MTALLATSPSARDGDSKNLDTTTTDATPITVYTYTLRANGSARVTVEWIAGDGTTGNDAYTGEISALVRAPSGISVLDSPTVGDGITRLSAGWSAGAPATKPSVTFYVSGLDASVLVFCKGKAATTINWRFTFRTNEV